MWIGPNEVSTKMIRVLDEKGKLIGDKPDISDEKLITMYKWMVLSRVYDEKALKLQRQGRIGTFAPISGQEAAQVGSAYALQKDDWIFPSYREIPASLVHGIPVSQLFLYTMGYLTGASSPKNVNVFPMQIIIAAQTLHAMGSAWASKYLGENKVSVAYLGDGGTSEGDFHEALNFAGVYQLPAIFFVQNNQWAISTPVKKQTASKSIAQKAIAYGVMGVQVDGNDILAVYQTMKEALEKARAGSPVLVEAITYRQGPHTSADDPTKYREKEDVDHWMAKDPVQRMKNFLIEQELWSEELDEQEKQAANDKVSEGLSIAESTPKSQLIETFDLVFAEIPSHLKEQKDSIQ